MRRRDQKDIWHGLYDFYMVETPRHIVPAKLFAQNKSLQMLFTGDVKALTFKKYKHVLTHQVIISTFTVIENNKGRQWDKHLKLKFFNKREIAALPKPVLINKFLQDYQLL
jgi:A/G-specific adenine glycosylase